MCAVEISNRKEAKFGRAAQIKGSGIDQACGGNGGSVAAVIGGVLPDTFC